jgi:hypothetical protein
MSDDPPPPDFTATTEVLLEGETAHRSPSPQPTGLTGLFEPSSTGAGEGS